jgi:transcription factor SFP1
MNGLRYHYMHSGEHGTIGLAMLTNATHPPPLLPASRAVQHSAAAASRSASPASAKMPSLPLGIVST